MDEHATAELSRIANAIEEILRLVKEDMKPKKPVGTCKRSWQTLQEKKGK